MPSLDGLLSIARTAIIAQRAAMNVAGHNIANPISTVNRLASQIAAVNSEILPAEAGGNTANDLRDSRDLLVDQLSKLIPVSVIDRGNGSNQVMLGGMPLIDGASAKSISL